MCKTPPWYRLSGQGRVHDDIPGDPEGTFVSVTFAVEAAVPFQRAADVVLRVDDRPVTVELHPLELREVPASAGRLGILAVPQVEAHLGSVELVIPRDRDEWFVRDQLGDES